ncbi:hypothetical protein niasHT_002085 [Heterodera trifolii]|uniref:Uncharacterized protein n=1 Tax=Heterodera trifolii TaxID=157864 RepID=A0ABD2M3V7_9BILA
MMFVFQRFAHLLYWSLLFVLVHVLDFVGKARLILCSIFCDRQTLDKCADNLSNKMKTKSNAATMLPQHIAFHLDDRRYINEAFVRSLVRHCAKVGIGRVTFSDSWSQLARTASTTAKNGTPFFDGTIYNDGANGDHFVTAKKRTATEEPNRNGGVSAEVAVRRLAHDEGRAAIVRACQKLSSCQLPVTTAQLMSTVLATDSADGKQPPAPPLDFFVRVGGTAFWRSVTLGAHSPLAIRTTEFHCVDGFSSDRMLSDREFDALLDQFSTRNRRFGR